MRTRQIVLILLVLVMASLISAASARSLGEILFGSDSAPREFAVPFNRIELVPRYRDTLDPLVYHVAERDGTISAVLPDPSMPIPLGSRPLMATTSALLMVGDARIVRLKPAANGRPIKVIVEPANGWEDETGWLREAMHNARMQVGLECDYSKLPTRERQKARELAKLEARQRGEEPSLDPGAFPPFVCLPAESWPEARSDGYIYFRNPQGILPVMIVTPVSNLLEGNAHSISLGVYVDRNRLWAETGVGFKTARAETFQVPNPELSQPRENAPAPEPPELKERVISVSPPKAENPVATGIPGPVEKWLYGHFGLARSQDWRRPCQFPAMNFPEDQAAANILFCCIRKDGSFFDHGAAKIYINGQLLLPEAPFVLMWPHDGSRPQFTHDGLVYRMGVPPGAKVRVEIMEFDLQNNAGPEVAQDEFVTGPIGTVTYRPIFER